MFTVEFHKAYDPTMASRDHDPDVDPQLHENIEKVTSEELLSHRTIAIRHLYKAFRSDFRLEDVPDMWRGVPIDVNSTPFRFSFVSLCVVVVSRLLSFCFHLVLLQILVSQWQCATSAWTCTKDRSPLCLATTVRAKQQQVSLPVLLFVAVFLCRSHSFICSVNILTGLFMGSRGDAMIGGYSVNNNMKEVRGSLGVCPQHNGTFFVVGLLCGLLVVDRGVVQCCSIC